MIAVASLYLGVVALMRLAFVGFTTDHIVGLFLAFASALLLGVIGPLYYTIWMRGRPMADLGLRRDNWRPTAVLALLFAGVQFALTLWGFDLPAPEDWVPLLVMALVVGVFEAIFFRGFVQNRLEAQFGPVLGIAGAAALYGCTTSATAWAATNWSSWRAWASSMPSLSRSPAMCSSCGHF